MKSKIVVKGPVNTSCLCVLSKLECGDAFIHPLNGRLYLVVHHGVSGRTDWGTVICLDITPTAGITRLADDTSVLPVNLDIKWSHQ